MIFCLSRIELSHFYIRTGIKMKEIGGTIQFKDAEEIERLIDEVEDLIETKFLRYCEILDPLHVFTMGIVRSATNAVRLRAQMPLLLKQTITDAQTRCLCALAEKILDTNSAIYRNPSMNRFRWQMQAFFLVAEVYANHEDLIKRKKALHVTIGRLTLKAWIANPPSNSSPEPAFITTLRAQHEPKVNRQQESVDEREKTGQVADDVFAFSEFSGDSDGTDLNLGSGFTLDSSDWLVWDQLCRGNSLG